VKPDIFRTGAHRFCYSSRSKEAAGLFIWVTWQLGRVPFTCQLSDYSYAGVHLAQCVTTELQCPHQKMQTLIPPQRTETGSGWAAPQCSLVTRWPTVPLTAGAGPPVGPQSPVGGTTAHSWNWEHWASLMEHTFFVVHMFSLL